MAKTGNGITTVSLPNFNRPTPDSLPQATQVSPVKRHTRLLRRKLSEMNITHSQQEAMRLIYSKGAIQRYAMALIGECLDNPNIGIRALPIGAEIIVKEYAYRIVVEMGMESYFLGQGDYLLYDPRATENTNTGATPDQVDVLPDSQ